MPAYLLVRANNLYGAFLEGQTPPLIELKGSIVEPRHSDDGYGAKEVLPKFVRIYCSDGELSDVEGFHGRWERLLDWFVVGDNASLDGYRLKIESTNQGAGDGAVKFADIQQMLLDWGAVVQSQAANAITVDMTVFRAIQSKGFWGRDSVGAINFVEQSYDQETGEHIVSADYSPIGGRPKNHDELVRQHGGTIISHVGRVIVFSINRTDIIQRFKQDLKKAGNQMVRPRRFRVADSIVDVAIAAGGEHIVTLAELQAGVIDDSA